MEACDNSGQDTRRVPRLRGDDEGVAAAALVAEYPGARLTTLREKLIKIGAKVVTHSRYVIFQVAEVAVPHALFAAILERIQCFGVPPPLVQRG